VPQPVRTNLSSTAKLTIAQLIDRRTLALVAICGVVFSLLVACRVNGSSSAFWYYDLHGLDEANGLIAGSPKPTRSDEWMVWTPAFLSQLRHEPPMPATNPSLGAGTAPLLMSVPVRHYSMFFRPQLWGFSFLNIEHGFAWYWNAKILGLFVSFSLLFRLLMRGAFALAFLGTLIVSYSSFIQWWFSSPAMLPEMLTCWALALVCGWSFFQSTALWEKIVAALVLISCGVNFALCCYPPFQIPLSYLALFLFGGFIWERRHTGSLREGLLWFAGSAVVLALVLLPTALQCRDTLRIVSHTTYPGARQSSGGQLSILRLLSGALNFFDGEQAHADVFANTSEASNFFPLWVVAAGLLIVNACRRPRKADFAAEPIAVSKSLLWSLAAFLFCFSIYAVVGLPAWVCRLTGLNFCTEQRALLAIGIAGLMLTLLMLRRDGSALVRGRAGIVASIVFAVLLLFLLWQSRFANPVFLSSTRFFLLFGTGLVIGLSYLCARAIIFGPIFTAALLLNNFLVNPIAEGLPVFFESTTARHIEAIRQSHPGATWAAYESSTLPEFLIASGARALNGVQIAPNLQLMGQIDRHGVSRDIYNRYAYIIFRLPRPGEAEPHFEFATADSYRVFVRPTDPVLRHHGLSFVVFRRLLAPNETEGMRLIDALPANRIWIYQID
jgi:hypothetical protein